MYMKKLKFRENLKTTKYFPGSVSITHSAYLKRYISFWRENAWPLFYKLTRLVPKKPQFSKSNQNKCKNQEKIEQNKETHRKCTIPKPFYIQLP